MTQQALIQPRRNDYPEAFEKIWAAYPLRGRVKGANDNKRAAYRQYQIRLRQGETPDEMLEGAKRYAEYIRAQNAEGTPFVKQCATFLGPDCHFLCDWQPPEEKKAAPKSDEDWLAAGREIGLQPKPGENWFTFKDRVKSKMEAA